MSVSAKPDPANAFGARDAVASVSVAVILIPQALAYAALAGLPPMHGLYAAAVAPIAAAPFVSSRYLQTGPVALTSVLTFGALASLALPGSADFVRLAALLAILVGTFRVLFGLGRGGWMAYLMSQPVLTGFMTAAAVLITASQLPTLIGVEGNIGGRAMADAVAALRAPSTWHLPSVLIGVVTLAFLTAGQRMKWRVPAVPVVAVAAVMGTAWLGFSGPLVGTLPLDWPQPTLDLPFDRTLALVVPAAVIALVGFAEASAISRHYAAKDRLPWNPDREFVGQGAANLAAGLAGGFPVGGSFSRTAINRRSGGKSRWVGAVSGVLVLLFIPVAGVLAGLPRTVLAAVVISAVVPLMDFKTMFEMTRTVRIQSLVAWVTFGATLLLAPRVDLAVVIGVSLAVLVHLWRELRVPIGVRVEGDTLRLEPIGVLFFGSAPGLEEALLNHLAQHANVTRLVVDLQRLGRIDYTGALALRGMVREAQEAGLDVRLERVPRHAIKVLARTLPEFGLR